MELPWGHARRAKACEPRVWAPLIIHCHRPSWEPMITPTCARHGGGYACIESMQLPEDIAKSICQKQLRICLCRFAMFRGRDRLGMICLTVCLAGMGHLRACCMRINVLEIVDAHLEAFVEAKGRRYTPPKWVHPQIVELLKQAPQECEVPIPNIGQQRPVAVRNRVEP